MEEGETFGKGESMFDFPCLAKNKNSSQDSDSEMEPYTKRKQSLTAGLERGGVVVTSVVRSSDIDNNSNSCT